MDLDDDSVSYPEGVDGVVGSDEVLLDADDDLVAGTAWETAGFTVEPFLSPADCELLRAGVSRLIGELLAEKGVRIDDDLVLERYHEVVGDRQEAHLHVARAVARGFPLERFPLPAESVLARIAEICGKPLRFADPETGENVFNLRVVRPQSEDNSPLHRDAWLDRLRNAVNIYAPLAGSNELSSLALVPGSHRWKESEIERTEEGAVINQVRYTVPAVVGSRRRLEIKRPDPGRHEVLVFSPYLIHGGATNRNADVTRVSLEMRFWREGR